jgi:hypothetical protein
MKQQQEHLMKKLKDEAEQKAKLEVGCLGLFLFVCFFSVEVKLLDCEVCELRDPWFESHGKQEHCVWCSLMREMW